MSKLPAAKAAGPGRAGALGAGSGDGVRRSTAPAMSTSNAWQVCVCASAEVIARSADGISSMCICAPSKNASNLRQELGSSSSSAKEGGAAADLVGAQAAGVEAHAARPHLQAAAQLPAQPQLVHPQLVQLQVACATAMVLPSAARCV